MGSPVVHASASRALGLVVGMGLHLVAGCTDPIAAIQFPVDAVEIAPAAPYARWWAMTESCAGQSGNMAQMHFYTVPHLTIDDGDAHYAGYWFQSGNRIALAEPFVTEGRVVRHEMLHAILGRGDHPRADFVDRCGGIVDFGDGLHEEASALLAGPVPGSPVLSSSEFQIQLTLSPQPVTLGAPDEGWVTATVVVTNPRNEPVWARILRPASQSSGPTLGIDVDNGATRVSRTRRSVDALMAFGAHEVKRQALDVKLDGFDGQRRARAMFNADTGAWQSITVQP
jgi:hypothetical protein